MQSILIDSNIILDIVTMDPNWADWSESILVDMAEQFQLAINPIIYSEISIGFKTIEALEAVIAELNLFQLTIPNEALFLAGKAFLKYKKNKGQSQAVLPDFFIGAHAAIDKIGLVTRDIKRYKTYYPTVKLISPALV